MSWIYIADADLLRLRRLIRRMVLQPNGCLTQDTSLTPDGYATVWAGKPKKTHRFVYELLVGPVPDGMTLDHTCCTRNCANVAHLEPVTRVENIQRAAARRATCRNGHPRTPDSTAKYGGERVCTDCSRERDRAYRARKRLLKQAGY